MHTELSNAMEAFNREDYYLAHEILEDFWNTLVGPDKQCVQALIQLTVVLHLTREGRFPGAQKVYARAEKNLIDCKTKVFGIDILGLQNQVKDILTKCINDNTRKFNPPIIQIS